MGTRKIRLVPKEKKHKIPPISPNHTMHMILEGKRADSREKDNEDVVVLITNGTLDQTKAHDYKYIQAIAKDIGWSTGRLNKALARVVKMLAEEKKQKEKKNASS